VSSAIALKDEIVGQ